MTLTSITPTPQQLKALTHPMRLRMLAMLRIDGPNTATTLAQRLGLNTGATSYHLRQLADAGFVVDDETRGNGRDRWWIAAHSSTDTAPQRPATGAAAEVLDAYLQSVVTVYTQQLQAAMEERPLLPVPWREASTFSDWVYTVTPERAQRIRDAVAAILNESDEDDDAEGAESFVVQLNAYPLPGRVGGQGS